MKRLLPFILFFIFTTTNAQYAHDSLKVDEGYINIMKEEGDDRVKATYGDNYQRLQKAKAK